MTGWGGLLGMAIGLLCVAFAMLVGALSHALDSSDPMPRWYWLSCAAAVVLGSTLVGLAAEGLS